MFKKGGGVMKTVKVRQAKKETRLTPILVLVEYRRKGRVEYHLIRQKENENGWATV